MSEFIIRPIALKQILTYFENPKNHTDDDKKHISKEEFKGAIGKISNEADEFLKEIVNSENGYATLRAMQKEGWINDDQVSMRDMYAANRGYGYYREPVKLMYKSHAIPLTVYASCLDLNLNSYTYVASRFTDGPLAGEIVNCPIGKIMMRRISFNAMDTLRIDINGKVNDNYESIITYEFWVEKYGATTTKSWRGVYMQGWDIKLRE